MVNIFLCGRTPLHNPACWIYLGLACQTWLPTFASIQFRDWPSVRHIKSSDFKTPSDTERVAPTPSWPGAHWGLRKSAYWCGSAQACTHNPPAYTLNVEQSFRHMWALFTSIGVPKLGQIAASHTIGCPVWTLYLWDPSRASRVLESFDQCAEVMRPPEKPNLKHGSEPRRFRHSTQLIEGCVLCLKVPCVHCSGKPKQTENLSGRPLF